MPKFSFTKTLTSVHMHCFKLNLQHNISANMFENIRQDSFWQWKLQFFLTLKMFCLALNMGICWRGWCEVTNSIGGRPLLFHKSKGILHGTLYFDLDSGLHFTLFTIDFRTLWKTIFKLLVWRSDKGNFTWNSFPSETLVDTRERIGNATALPTVKNYQRKTWTFAFELFYLSN